MITLTRLPGDVPYLVDALLWARAVVADERAIDGLLEAVHDTQALAMSHSEYVVLTVALGHAKGHCTKQAAAVLAKRGEVRAYHSWLFKRDEYCWMLKRFRRQANGKQPPEVLGTWVDKNTRCV